ncbi:MAG TPA: ATP cone domain-containing protein [Ignavibacteriaceae bacterium]|nr:ATP cone domain-containing protein [Ignavibacteriaceae bacterium]
MSRITHVIKRSGALVPFSKERIINAIFRAAVEVGGRDKEKAEELSNSVIRELEKTCAEGCYPHIEEIQDVVEKVLIEEGHAKVAKAYIIYRADRAKKREADRERASNPSENIPWVKIWHVLDWASSHNLHTVKHYNERVKNGEYKNIITESETAYENELDTAAEMIIARSNGIKMVIVTGPSSSGKTTTTLKLEQRLKRKGFKFVPLIVDHYFYDLEMHPKDEFGDYDFETPQALDLELINEHLAGLCSGKEVVIPYYDFKTGKRTLNQTKMKLEKDEILLIDSLHGLYPKMTEAIPDESKFRLYLEPLLQMKDNAGNYIKWTDIRLIRRMLRDAAYRAYKPQQTLEHWHYVRNSELRHIIPYNTKADFIINSAMPYELSLYRHKLLKEFSGWITEYKDNPLRVDAFTRAERIFNFLNSIVPVEDDSVIPNDSVIREFIGGSTLNLH